MVVRDQRVMIDSDLAGLYGVETRVLVQAVKRNLDRFPIDFMFQLTPEEVGNLRSQSVMSRWGGRRGKSRECRVDERCSLNNTTLLAGM